MPKMHNEPDLPARGDGCACGDPRPHGPHEGVLRHPPAPCGKDSGDGDCVRPTGHTGPCRPLTYLQEYPAELWDAEPVPERGRMPVAFPDTEALRQHRQAIEAELRRRSVFAMPGELMNPIAEGVGRAFDAAEARGEFDCCVPGSGKSHAIDHYGRQLAEVMRRDAERGDDEGRDLMVRAAHRAGVMFPDEMAVPIDLLERVLGLLQAQRMGLPESVPDSVYALQHLGDLLQGHRLAHQNPGDGDAGVQGAGDGTEQPDDQSRPHG